MSRNYTRELRRAQEQGAKIVCSVAPYEGEEVIYFPRQKGDPQPWKVKRLSGRTGFRYSGRECHAVVTVKTGRQEIDVKGSVSPGRVSGTVVAVRPAERRSPAPATETPSTA